MYDKSRKLIFDTAVFLYSILIAAYLINQLAGALGLEVSRFDESLFVAEYFHLRPYLIVLAMLSALLSYGADRFQLPTIGNTLFISRRDKSLSRSFWRWHLIFLTAVTLWVSWQVTEVSFTELFDPNGLEGAGRLWSGLTHPNLTLLPRAIAQATETIFIAFLATVIAIPLAFLLAFFCAKNLMTSPLQLTTYAILRAALNITRSVEPLIWALIFTVWVGVGPFAGMLALMLHSAASLTKYYSEIIEDVEPGPIDGVRSTGANEVQVVWYAIVPQVILPYIAMTVYRWDTNVRMATVIGLVGGGGIGTLLIQYQGQAMWPEVGCIILVIAVIVWLMDTASAYIREALK